MNFLRIGNHNIITPQPKESQDLEQIIEYLNGDVEISFSNENKTK